MIMILRTSLDVTEWFHVDYVVKSCPLEKRSHINWTGKAIARIFLYTWLVGATATSALSDLGTKEECQSHAGGSVGVSEQRTQAIPSLTSLSSAAGFRVEYSEATSDMVAFLRTGKQFFSVTQLNNIHQSNLNRHSTDECLVAGI